MDGRRLLFALLLFGCFVSYPIIAFTSSGGAPAQRTGARTPSGFELTCAESGCHSGSPLNHAPGSLVIEAPATYSAGQRVEFKIKLSHPQRYKFGFAVTVKDGGHTQTGRLINLDTKTKHTYGNSGYVTHSRANATGEWSVIWEAPEVAAGEVVIYAAGNAADGDDMNSAGDLIYTASHAMQPASTVSTKPLPASSGFELRAAYPNPFRSATSIPFTLAEAAPVVLTVYDLSGRTVSVQNLGVRAAGDHVQPIEAGGWPAGMYVYELLTPAFRQARPMIVLK